MNGCLCAEPLGVSSGNGVFRCERYVVCVLDAVCCVVCCVQCAVSVRCAFRLCVVCVQVVYMR